MEKTAIKDTFRILHFQSQGMHFCVDLNGISKVLPLILFEPIPGSAHFVAGLMNIAGQSVPAIDFGLYLGLNRRKPYTLETPILLCKNDYNTMGIIVDEVVGIHCIEKKSLQLLDQFKQTHSSFIATVMLKNKLALLVNIDEVIKIDFMTTQPGFILDNQLVNKIRIES